MSKRELVPVESQEVSLPIAPPKLCHFSGDGRCRSWHDERNKFAPKKGATVRVNDYFICNWHYEHGYDRTLRAGEVIPVHEQKIQAKLFGRG